MLYSHKTYDSQKRLSQWVRTGVDTKVPGATAQGLKQYRRLFRNNINNTLTQAYPITSEVLSEEQWNNLVDDFFGNHDANTPQVWKLPLEFYEFVRNANYAEILGFPFLNDLLYFEWLEIEVYTMKNEYPEPFNTFGNTMKSRIEVNPEYRLVGLEYPVHLYAGAESLKHKASYYLLTYRTPKTRDVKFMDLPAVHVLFFEKIVNQGMTANEIIEEILEQNHKIQRDQITQNISEFIKTMIDEKVFLGFSENYLN